jgi:threonine synthase
LKNDGLNPSGSLKDRASFFVVAEAERLKEKVIVAASTGNAASSLAAVCASTEKEAVIFVPESAPKAKLVQMILYGARVVPIKGTYDDAFRLSLEYTQKKGGLNRNTAYHPLTIEGKKTAGFEIFKQNNGKAPDVIVVPVGDGVIIAGIFKAFYDLKRADLLQTMPRLIGVQAEKSNAIAKFVTTGKYSNVEQSKTIADSISVSVPSNAYLARRAIIESDGFCVTVNDEEILTAQAFLASRTGIFAEPAAASTVAALTKLRTTQKIDKKEQIVLLITGIGLKDIEAPLSVIKFPKSIEPDLSEVV